eukprot:7957793-Pyramimonas_sp.AAC.1
MQVLGLIQVYMRDRGRSKRKTRGESTRSRCAYTHRLSCPCPVRPGSLADAHLDQAGGDLVQVQVRVATVHLHHARGGGAVGGGGACGRRRAE